MQHRQQSIEEISHIRRTVNQYLDRQPNFILNKNSFNALTVNINFIYKEYGFRFFI